MLNKVQDVLNQNDLLGIQIIKYQSTLSNADKRSTVLKQVETIISEPSSTVFQIILQIFLILGINCQQTELNTIASECLFKSSRSGDRFKQIWMD